MSMRASRRTLRGHLVRRFREGPAAISYVIETGLGWKTKAVRVDQFLGGERRSLQMRAVGSRWYVEGKENGRLRGCTDVDLQASPVTNTLPIKRTTPRVGSTTEVTVAWVRFPGLDVEPLRQSYERVGEGRYVYRSATGFESEIEVDRFGLVRSYGDFWQAL